MAQLNDKAHALLLQELKRCCRSSPMGMMERDLVMKRLERFHQRSGPPLTESGIRELVIDLFPEFDEAVIRRAAKVNQPARHRGALGWGAGLLAGAGVLAGGLWVVNLPYPMIRWPVSRVAPMLLTPSYLQMDRSYRQTVSLVEQADQLLNRATAAADIELGEEKVTQAQYHLDRLPVWFLGYYPQRYCTLFSCSWRFTLDEFESARAAVGRMEAQVFQERNALELLDAGTAAVESAQQQYQAAQNPGDQQAAIAAWQTGLDQLAQIPSQTLAGGIAQQRLQAYERDFQPVAAQAQGGRTTGTLLEVAMTYGSRAAQASQNPPHPADEWERIATFWEQAIQFLDQVDVTDSGFNQAQAKRAEYLDNLSQTRQLANREASASQTLSDVKAQTEILLEGSETGLTPSQVASRLQRIINQLETVQPNTTAYAEAQTYLTSARNRLAQLQPSQ